MSEWQPIETAPKDGQSLLVWCPIRNRGGRATVAYWDDYWSLTHPGGWAEDDDCDPTHWMPLPAPPKP